MEYYQILQEPSSRTTPTQCQVVIVKEIRIFNTLLQDTFILIILVDIWNQENPKSWCDLLLSSKREKFQRANINSISGLNIVQTYEVEWKPFKEEWGRIVWKRSIYEMEHFTMNFLHIVIVKQITSTFQRIVQDIFASWKSIM